MNSTTTLAPGLKGFPHGQAPLSSAEIGGLGWNVLDGRLPLPLAVLKCTALEHNLRWMQNFVRDRGIDLAPHGKTKMSPQLFARQLDAGAWGLTFANVTQLAVGVAAGARRALIANQVFGDDDFAGIQAMLEAHANLRIVFLIDSTAQLALIESWFAAHPGSVPFETMLEIGVSNARAGCRTHDEAATLARARAACRHRVLRGSRRDRLYGMRHALRRCADGPCRVNRPLLRCRMPVRRGRGAGLGRRLIDF